MIQLEQMAPIVLVIAGIVVMAALAWYSYAQARARREAFALLAAQLGMTYRDKDRTLPSAYHFLDALRQGSNRYAFNIIEGDYRGYRVKAFDYHYETHSTDSKGRRQTHHHYFSFFILEQPINFPELRIYPESFLGRLAQMVGFADIDFESVEFSKAFTVRARDKKFAYDVCHTRMMEFLLRHRDTSLELEGPCMAIRSARRLAPEQIVPMLDRLVEINGLLPEYLRQDLAQQR